MYICILDFEATCDNKKYMPHEIIEFPSVLVKINDNNTISYLSEFQIYCSPKENKTLSEFCVGLTGITQDNVDNGVFFPEALQRHFQWISHTIPGFKTELENKNVIIMTFGDMDMETFAVDEFKRYNIKIDCHDQFYMKYVDIKKEFSKMFKIGKKFGLKNFIDYIGQKFEGRQHSGLVDCKNTVKMLEHMVKHGYNKNKMTIQKLKVQQ